MNASCRSELARTLDRFTVFAAAEGFALTFDDFGETNPAAALADSAGCGGGLACEIVEANPDGRSLAVAFIPAEGGAVILLAARRGARSAGRFDGLARRLRADGFAAVDFGGGALCMIAGEVVSADEEVQP